MKNNLIFTLTHIYFVRLPLNLWMWIFSNMFLIWKWHIILNLSEFICLFGFTLNLNQRNFSKGQLATTKIDLVLVACLTHCSLMRGLLSCPFFCSFTLRQQFDDSKLPLLLLERAEIGFDVLLPALCNWLKIYHICQRMCKSMLGAWREDGLWKWADTCFHKVNHFYYP